MILGYMQASLPLRRKPLPLPPDEALWPHVDVLIPTYNEPLALVRYTALAAINIDYPPEKLHVYILDDGTREDFRLFAAEAGVGYITRTEHNHAKAGNINHALGDMNAPFVAIFDCDHVPTRSFLQLTLGWFLAEDRLGMLQTPHHFYSPDPFERNLLRYKTIPNEGELFYGILQDGNDLWNATFFCGSCAVLRRKALDQPTSTSLRPPAWPPKPWPPTSASASAGRAAWCRSCASRIPSSPVASNGPSGFATSTP
jgi:cellulose synthase (UDP-forming)